MKANRKMPRKNNRNKNKELSTSRRLALKALAKVGVSVLLGATVIATYHGNRKKNLPEIIADDIAKPLGDQMLIVDGWILHKKDLR